MNRYPPNSIDLQEKNELINLHDRIYQAVLQRRNTLEILNDKIVLGSIAEATELIIKTYKNSGKVMIAGNGGSSAQSQHFCAELMGRLKVSRNPFPAISLCNDQSTLTCIANDFGYERIFSRQIEGLANKNDIFIAITTSGKSRNIIEAICECKQLGIKTIVLTGNHAISLSQADCIISLPVEDACILQELQLQIIHIISDNIERILSVQRTIWDKLMGFNSSYNALILDRDGVINHVKANGYIHSFDEFHFNADFLSRAKELSNRFKYIFIASNQKGVGKGVTDIKHIDEIHHKMVDKIEEAGGRIDKIYISTGIDSTDKMRKPNAGMALLMKKDYPDLDLKKAIVVGDSDSDRLFAHNIGAQFFYATTR